MIVPLDIETWQSLEQAGPVVSLHCAVVAAAALGPPDDDHRAAFVNSADVSRVTEIRLNLPRPEPTSYYRKSYRRHLLLSCIQCFVFKDSFKLS